FLLAGHSPFHDGTVAQKLIWHQVRQPKPLRDLRPDLPEGLSAVIDKMIAKERGQRYQSPLEVAQALEPWTAAPIGPPPEAEMPAPGPSSNDSGPQSPSSSERTPGAASGWSGRSGPSTPGHRPRTETSSGLLGTAAALQNATPSPKDTMVPTVISPQPAPI